MANETKVKKWNLNVFKRFLIDNFNQDELADCIIEYMQPSDIRRVMDDYGYNEFDYSASTKKSKIKKSTGLDRIWQDWMNVSDEEAEAITDVFDEYGLDFDNVGGLIQLASDKVDGKRASTKKSKVAKREWAEDNYNPVSTEEQIESAFKSQYGNKEIVKLEYVGTDWEMGSQYWILMYDEGQGTLFDEDRRYSVVTVIDWTYDNPDRGITFNFGAYELHRDVAEDVFNEKVQRESDGTRKMKKTKKASTPDVKMSFTDNVNKMRVNNYAKTGNINTVMKKRD